MFSMECVCEVIPSLAQLLVDREHHHGINGASVGPACPDRVQEGFRVRTEIDGKKVEIHMFESSDRGGRDFDVSPGECA